MLESVFVRYSSRREKTAWYLLERSLTMACFYQYSSTDICDSTCLFYYLLATLHGLYLDITIELLRKDQIDLSILVAASQYSQNLSKCSI